MKAILHGFDEKPERLNNVSVDVLLVEGCDFLVEAYYVFSTNEWMDYSARGAIDTSEFTGWIEKPEVIEPDSRHPEEIIGDEWSAEQIQTTPFDTQHVKPSEECRETLTNPNDIVFEGELEITGDSCISEPQPAFTAQVECWRPSEKLPDKNRTIIAYIRGFRYVGWNDGTRFYYLGAEEYFKWDEIDFYHYPINQPLQLPKGWHECKAGSMPEDVGYEENYAWSANKFHTAKSLTHEVNKSQNVPEQVYWAPYGPIDPAPIEAYIKAKDSD